MDSKDTKTVINIGWNTVKSSLMKNFSAFAEKGYILSEMDDKQFIFRKSNPQSIDFYLYSESADKRHREYDSLTEKGWTELCSYGEYRMMTAPKDTPLPERKYNPFGGKIPYILAAVFFVILLAISILIVPNTTEVLSAVRTVLTAVSAGGLVFCLTNIFSGKKKKM